MDRATLIGGAVGATIGGVLVAFAWTASTSIPPASTAPVTAPATTEVELPGQGRGYILCDGGNRVYFSPGGGIAVTLDRNECP